jgi:hypothetical protein
LVDKKFKECPTCFKYIPLDQIVDHMKTLHEVASDTPVAQTGVAWRSKFLEKEMKEMRSKWDKIFYDKLNRIMDKLEHERKHKIDPEGFCETCENEFHKQLKDFLD